VNEFEQVDTQHVEAPKGKSMGSLLRDLHRRTAGDAVAVRERADPASKLGSGREDHLPISLEEDGFRISNRVGGKSVPSPADPEEALRFPRRSSLSEESGDAKAHVREAMRLFSEAIEHLAAAYELL